MRNSWAATSLVLLLAPWTQPAWSNPLRASILGWGASRGENTGASMGSGTVESPDPNAWSTYSAFSVPLKNRMDGISYLGSAARLRKAASKLLAGHGLKFAAVGGSITVGQGTGSISHTWAHHFLRWLHAVFPSADHHYFNGAVPGTTSMYTNACLQRQLPDDHADLDIVFVEYAVNDLAAPDAEFSTAHRRSMERLIRKLLTLPSRPAVVMVNFHSYRLGRTCCKFYSNAERDFNEFSLYYALPTLSFKSAVFHKVNHNETGYTFDELYLAMHPNRQGHAIMGELLVTLVQRVLAEQSLGALALSDQQLQAAVDEGIPVPMIANNYESSRNLCFTGQLFQQRVTASTGWEWTDEHRGVFKYGFVSETVYSQLFFQVNTIAAAAGQEGTNHTEVLVQVAYLQSYIGMGQAQVTCAGGCTCLPIVIDAHSNKTQTSLTQLAGVAASQHEACTVAVKVLPTSSSGSHKFKVLGVVVNEEPGGHGERAPINFFRERLQIKHQMSRST